MEHASRKGPELDIFSSRTSNVIEKPTTIVGCEYMAWLLMVEMKTSRRGSQPDNHKDLKDKLRTNQFTWPVTYKS